ncbi:K(+)-stimulated pyrophosphate-energized sodium pump, partial [termite gut metagenome]
GDTVGDPFKDTSSVSLNPIIKFSTLFGLLATEICIEMRSNSDADFSMYIAIPFLLLGLLFVWRSFYKMRIPNK